MPTSALDRMWTRVAVGSSPASCWLWTGAQDGRGYGKLRVGPGSTRMIAPHRVSYKAYYGEIPDAMVLDHLCREPLCVNPLHLRVVDRAENVRSGVAAQPHPERHISTCKNGHDMAVNGRRVSTTGQRYCRGCKALWARAYYWRRKA